MTKTEKLVSVSAGVLEKLGTTHGELLCPICGEILTREMVIVEPKAGPVAEIDRATS